MEAVDPDHDGRRYRILDVLGKGGFGTVYRAEMSSPGGFVKEVALKVVQGDLERQDEKLRRLRDEARLLGLLRHRAIVGVDALTRLGERWAVVMEYVQGVTVRDLLDRYQTLPMIVALQVTVEIASALHAAWEARATAKEGDGAPQPLRLLHRDVKPSNIQLTRHGDVKLLDFGIARTSADLAKSPSGIVYGSVPYLAPERFLGQDAHQSDVYSLALTFVQMVTGQLPRPGAPPAERIAHAHQLLDGVGASAELQAAVAAALAPEPSLRPDARTFGLSLKRVQRAYTVFEPRDWTEEHVGSILDSRTATAGDLTGMSFADGTVSATELFALGKAAATFDDPLDAGRPANRPPIDHAEQTTSGLVIPQLPGGLPSIDAVEGAPRAVPLRSPFGAPDPAQDGIPTIVDATPDPALAARRAPAPAPPAPPPEPPAAPAPPLPEPAPGALPAAAGAPDTASPGGFALISVVAVGLVVLGAAALVTVAAFLAAAVVSGVVVLVLSG